MKTLILLHLIILSACTQVKERREEVKEARGENIEERQEQRRKGDDVKEDSPDYAPIYPSESNVHKAQDGSLFNPNIGSIFSGQKKYQVGDIINIRLKEETVANKNAKSSLD